MFVIGYWLGLKSQGRISSFQKSKRGTSEAAHTELRTKVTLQDMGTERRPNFDCKGGESRDLLPFFVSLVSEMNQEDREVQILGEALEELVAMIRIMTTSERKMEPHKIYMLNKAWLEHCRALQQLCLLLPKHHAMGHGCERASTIGNPTYTSCYDDETRNRWQAKICKSAHRLTMAITSYARWKLVYHS